jgi:hypothetical protein
MFAKSFVSNKLLAAVVFKRCVWGSGTTSGFDVFYFYGIAKLIVCKLPMNCLIEKITRHHVDAAFTRRIFEVQVKSSAAK